MNFRDKLISELTQSDMRQSTKKGYNRFALGIYFQAADSCIELINKGATQETAFTECFTPCREMHKVAKRLGLRLDVDRGQWWIPQT